MINKMSSCRDILPLFVSGTVVKGFGRGSKDLGIPTANFSDDVVSNLPNELNNGIYYGFASIDNGPTIYEMVMSIGWNPYYKNQRKSMEAHLISKFDEDFYNSNLKAIILDYIRPEKSFKDIGELIEAIQNDIKIAKDKLSSESLLASFRNSLLFSPEHNSEIKNGIMMLNSNGTVKFTDTLINQKTSIKPGSS